MRVFSVANEIALSDSGTYQKYRDKMFAMMDATYPGRASLVQSGVDDVASHIQPADPTAPPLVLVNFPEDVGLPAAMIGTRGFPARLVTTSTQAYLALFSTYATQRNYYRLLYGLNGGDIVPQVVMATTDTVYRAFYETFRDIATTYGVYVTAGANVPPARVVHESDDPDLYAKLIDPDEEGIRDYVYVATSPVVHNSTFLFQPDGEIFVQRDDGTVTSAPSGTDGLLRGSANKVYLTPVELNLLKLFDAPVDELDVLDTPVGRLGVVISKDAWMIDVNDRLAARHAHMMIQSEAFSSWAYQAEPWDPDIFKQGGYNNLQKYSNRVCNVAPSLVGNLYEITFDGQSAILGRHSKDDPGPLSVSNAWIGQNPDSGFRVVAPWIEDDPGIADPGLGLAQRRAGLVASGAALLPGSGIPCGGPLVVGACEGGYRESVVWNDVEVPDGVDVFVPTDDSSPAPTSWGSSVQVNDDDDAMPSSQLFPQLTADGDGVWVVWQDTRHGNDAVYGAVSSDGGVTWSADVKISDDAAGSRVELLPDIAFHRDAKTGVGTVYVVWQRLGEGGNDNDSRIMLARFDEGFAKVDNDVRVDDRQDAGKWQPTVATLKKRGDPVVIWVDEEPGPTVSVLEHLRARRSRSRRGPDGRVGLRFRKARAVVKQKRKTVARDALQLANEWAPAIATGSRKVYTAWLDFRDYNWDVYASFSRNGGGRFRRAGERVDDSTEFERLNSHPSLAFDDASERLVLVWSDQRERHVDTDLYVATSSDDGRTWSDPERLDDGDAGVDPDSGRPSNQWQPEISIADGLSCVAWQDDRLGNNDVFAAVGSGATFGPDERVDDSGDGRSEQTSPAVTVSEGRCYVVWSDDRSGDSDVRLARKDL